MLNDAGRSGLAIGGVMQRRDFIRTSLLGSAAWLTFASRLKAESEVAAAYPNKRERMLTWLEGRLPPGYAPGAFFVHFDKDHKFGAAAAAKHLEYFEATGMDFVKIQYEREYPRESFLRAPSDWSRLTLKGLDFFEPQLDLVRRIVNAKKREALVLVTLYSPFMCAGHSATRKVLLQHIEENPDAVRRGLDTIVESQLLFVNACIAAGVDGFYMATQGSETQTLSHPALFTEYVKPADLVPMREAHARCAFNILHVCDDNAPYASYDAVADYPGHVISCCPDLVGGTLTWEQISNQFKRPGMGGMKRRGLVYSGSPQEIRDEVRRVVSAAPRRFILGADCTVPADTDWGRIRTAIAAAHEIS